MNRAPDVGRIEDALVTLNYRLTKRALDLAIGKDPAGRNSDLYEGFEQLLDPETVRNFQTRAGLSDYERRIFHTLLGHCIQRGALPYENEFSMWTRGAAAVVEGEKVYLRDIHSWCQKKSDLGKRRILEKETSGLSKFLKPFALGSWEYVLELIEKDFEYGSYIAYCHEKKGIDYASQASSVLEFLDSTAALYFDAMDAWTQKSLGIPLNEANRFDAIYLMGLGELDPIFPSEVPLVDHLRFFDCWGVKAAKLPGLHLHTEHSGMKGAQGITFAVRIPQEIHVVINPQGGWIDFETLFHEMGHALSSIFTSSSLSPVEKDFNTSNTLSESFAFLVQNMCFSPLFLERRLGLGFQEIETLRRYKALKDMAFFRRYAAKFLAEYKMFEEKTVGDGLAYASILKDHTGFSYKPETQFFDLAPELYALDYVMAWMAEASMERFLSENLGEEWMFKREAGEILIEWWKNGNRDELEVFLDRGGIGPLDYSDLSKRWSAALKG